MKTVHAVVLAGSVALALGAGIPSAAALVLYPWCSWNKLGRNCGFTSYQQCLATIQGNGGTCSANVWYEPFPPPASYSAPIWKEGPVHASIPPISRLQNTR
jgi:hypothetical protein